MTKLIQTVVVSAALGMAACGGDYSVSLDERMAAEVSALHSWNGYHWANRSPSVKDKTGSSLYDITAAVNEWADLVYVTADGTTVSSPMTPSMTAARKGDITVIEQTSVFWIGLAQIWIEDGHITKGQVKLNTKALDNYGAFAADHVACQEIGHTLGLGHTCTAGDASCPDYDIDTCMNYCLNCVGSDSPNNHDLDQLVADYGHTDADSGPAPKPCKGKKCKSGGWVTVHVVPIP